MKNTSRPHQSLRCVRIIHKDKCTLLKPIIAERWWYLQALYQIDAARVEIKELNMKLTKSKKYQNVYSYNSKKGTLYAIRFVYYDLYGKRREKQQRGFKTELLAHKAELALEIKYSENEIQQIMDSTMTVKEWIPQYIEISKNHWRPTTQRNVQSIVKKYILPLLGNQRLDNLTKAKYMHLFIDPQLKSHLSPDSITQHNRIFMAIINSAVENDILAKNRLRGLRLESKHTRLAFDKDDLKKLNDTLPKIKLTYHTLITTLELTGMRRGEALALTWDDIDFEKKTININRTRMNDIVGPPKTPSSTRIIAITPSLVKLLKHYQLAQRKTFFRLGIPSSSDNYIFTSERDGKPLCAATVTKMFKITLRKAGIDKSKYVLHCLRHTHATLLLAAGANPVDVAKRLGHSNANITLSIYAHAIAGNDRLLAEKIEKLAAL